MLVYMCVCVYKLVEFEAKSFRLHGTALRIANI